MADRDNPNKIGYAKPPKQSQFVKGQSGNPNGRPKGSQNLATLLRKIMRQLVKVTENGRSLEMSKGQAILVQLTNKALRGDIQAIHEFRHWNQWFEDSTKVSIPSPISNDDDSTVIASILERIQRSYGLAPHNGAHPATADSPREVK
jgi:hypothetical protein